MFRFTSLIISTLLLCESFMANASTITRKIELVQTYEPKYAGESADLFIPLPMDNLAFQKIVTESQESNATWVKKESIPINKSGDSVEVLHAHWKSVKNPKLKLTHVINVTNRDGGLPTDEVDPYFLKASNHVQIDGIVQTTTRKVTKGISDPDKKARAIYDWIVENTFRDPNVRGCGLGDVKTTLRTGNFKGKCADLNSLFVGMARAAGIPAREFWGIRVALSDHSKSLGKEGDVSEGQHCRSEYYSTNQKAWIPVDPADVRKVILEENLPLTDAHVKDIRERFFGTWEGNWVALNYGRDIHLSNGQTINFLMYPQLVSESFAPDGIDPTEAGYSIISKVLSKK